MSGEEGADEGEDDTRADESGDGESGADAATVRAYLLREHRPLLETILGCAETAAEAGERAADTGTASADRFQRELRERGVVERLPDVLAGAVDALGASLPAEPVAAPPYVVLTRAGPVVRATLPDRGRLVVTVAAFERRDGAWVRSAETPEEALRVELR